MNAVNRLDRTCKVPRKNSGRSGLQRADQEFTAASLRRARHSRVRAPQGTRPFAEYLVTKGGIGADVPVAQPKAVHHDSFGVRT